MKTLKELPAKTQLAGQAARLIAGKICELLQSSQNEIPPSQGVALAGIYERLRRFGESNMYLPLGEGIKTVPPSYPSLIGIFVM